MRFVVENLEDSERPYAPWTDKTGLADEFPFATALVPLIAFVEVRDRNIYKRSRIRVRAPQLIFPSLAIFSQTF